MSKEPPTELNLEQQGPLTVRRDADGRLVLIREGTLIHVTVRPCFPWTRPRGLLSLRNSDNEELVLVESLESLDTESRTAVEAALAEARFTFNVTTVHAIDRDFELRVWKVETTQGKRTFLTEFDEFPYPMENGGLRIRDLGGDTYLIPNPDSLDRRSRELLFSFRD
jgi:hypothetical protein